MKKLIILFFLLFIQAKVNAQRIDNTSSLFQIQDSSYGRVSYDNDLFQGKDFYYTQGVTIDVYNTKFKKNPINYALLHFRNSVRSNYGIQLASTVYTPTSILSDSILKGDRPFAAILDVGFIQSTMQKNAKRMLTTQLDLGVIGPAGLGKEMQTEIHKLTHNDLPHGWQYQIKNDLLINYTNKLEQRLFAYRRLFAVDAIGQLKLGTYQTNLMGGINLSFGQKNDLYTSIQKKFQYFVYSQTMIRAIGYDASLQGGIFSRDQAYRLHYNQINPFVIEQHVGIVFSAPHFYFGVDFGFITKEIKQGISHGWGGLRLGFN